MFGILCAFFASLSLTLLIIRFQRHHERFSGDWNSSEPQKIHSNIVPRIGGIGIFIGIVAALLINKTVTRPVSNEILILISCIPTFAVGLTEDLTKKISVRIRLLLTAFSATLLILLLPIIQITMLGSSKLDSLISIPVVSIAFTIFAITGLANAYNIIDGFNGLASMTGIIALTGIAYISYTTNDWLIFELSLIIIASILAFFLCNYPLGLIFLGDGGAYLVGFLIACLSIMLVNRNPNELSPWVALLINAYPTFETILTIYRRMVHKKSSSRADALHFHTLIYRRTLKSNAKKILLKNSKTAPLFWVFSILTVTVAAIFRDSTIYLALFCILFATLYLWLYLKIINFQTPDFLLRIYREHN